MYYRLSRQLVLPQPLAGPEQMREVTDKSLVFNIGVFQTAPRFYVAHSPPSRRGGGGRRRLVRRLVLAVYRQLLFCHLIYEGGGTSARSPARYSPVEPARPLSSSIARRQPIPAIVGAPQPGHLDLSETVKKPRAGARAYLEPPPYGGAVAVFNLAPALACPLPRRVLQSTRQLTESRQACPFPYK